MLDPGYISHVFNTSPRIQLTSSVYNATLIPRMNRTRGGGAVRYPASLMKCKVFWYERSCTDSVAKNGHFALICARANLRYFLRSSDPADHKGSPEAAPTGGNNNLEVVLYTPAVQFMKPHGTQCNSVDGSPTTPRIPPQHGI